MPSFRSSQLQLARFCIVIYNYACSICHLHDGPCPWAHCRATATTIANDNFRTIMLSSVTLHTIFCAVTKVIACCALKASSESASQKPPCPSLKLKSIIPCSYMESYKWYYAKNGARFTIVYNCMEFNCSNCSDARLSPRSYYSIV